MREGCIYVEFCEVYDCSNCPLDDLDNLNGVPFYLEKDRSASRNRHHGKMKAKKKSIQNARFLSSKADKVAEIVPWEDPPRVQLRAIRALKESQRYKKFYKTES